VVDSVWHTCGQEAHTCTCALVNPIVKCALSAAWGRGCCRAPSSPTPSTGARTCECLAATAPSWHVLCRVIDRLSIGHLTIGHKCEVKRHTLNMRCRAAVRRMSRTRGSSRKAQELFPWFVIGPSASFFLHKWLWQLSLLCWACVSGTDTVNNVVRSAVRTSTFGLRSTLSTAKS